MTHDKFITACAIISSYHTTTMTINKPITQSVGELGKTRFSIHLTKCCPAVIIRLMNAGYRLAMGENGLSVE